MFLMAKSDIDSIHNLFLNDYLVVDWHRLACPVLSAHRFGGL